jgi:hypothetical protein
MKGLGMVLVLLGLLCPAFGQQGDVQPAPVGREVTIKGPLLSTFHFKGPEAQAHDPEAHKGGKSILVMYAFDGPPEVKAALDEVLDEYYPEVRSSPPGITTRTPRKFSW